MHFSTNIILITFSTISLILFIWTILQQLSLGKIKKSQKKLFQGKSAQSLEEVILTHQDNLSNLNNQLMTLSSRTDSLTTLSNAGLNKVGMVRFNPFKNLGGNQSFSIAFLNSHHNGLVISSIYSNDGSRFYSKTIADGKSQKQYPLTKEEEQAIAIAIGKDK
jgi:hypothetical protein